MTLWAYGASIIMSGNMVSGMIIDGSFPQLVAEKLKQQGINRGIPGASNHEIFMRLVMDIKKGMIKKEDIIYINWTYINRMYCALTNGSILPSHTIKDPNPVDKQIDHKTASLLFQYMYDDNKGLADLVGNVFTVPVLLPHNRIYFTVSGLCHMSQTESSYKIDSAIFQSLLAASDRLNIGKLDLESWVESDASMATQCGHFSAIGHQHIANVIYEAMS